MKWSLTAALYVVLFAAVCLGSARAVPLVWFCPNDSKLIISSSYDAQWPRGRSHVQVYKFYYQVIRDSPVAELKAKFQWLKGHHIAMAVEWPAMTWTENGPGYTVEGFNPPNTSAALVNKIQSAGGTLDYVAMDEPLFFGHFDSGPHSAHWPISTIAANVVANLKQVWAVFPQCKAGDIEPVDAMPPAQYLSATTEWLRSFQQVSGHRLAFLHDDILWANGWRQSVPKISGMLTAKKVDFGVIFNAAGGEGPDARWVESAQVNIRNYNAAKVPKPDHVIFQTWYPYPAAVLPETTATSFSSLINYYYSASATQTPPMPFYRLYNGSLAQHRYTSIARVAASLKAQGWIQEPPAGNIYRRSAEAPGLIPLYQLSGGKSDYVLTTSRREKSKLLASGYGDDGIAGYVFDAANPAGQPLYHAGSAQHQNFYTCNRAEYDSLTAPTWQRYGPICTMP